ncbi:hypothetical protein DIPPA_19464 [Diplonema papillatum]|nr:hypothetical protein DIPPA_19464 [Diplonema papillatum]
MDGLPEELTTLKEEVIHGGVQFDDVAEARDRSQRMKQVMMTTPSRLVKEVTRMKEEATKLNDELDSRDALGKKMQQEKQQLQFEVKNLKEDTAMRIKRAEKKSLDYHKVKADADTYETAVDQAVSSKQEASLPYDNGGMYLRFLTGRNETLLKLRCAAARFDSFGLIDAKAWSAGPRTDPQSLSYLLQEVADFKTVLDEARTELPILEKLQGRLAQSDFPCDVDLEEYRGALEAAEAAHDGWDKKVTAEEERRVNYEACVDEFMKELSRLVDWCKAQRQTLSQLQTTENVQEFCASLQGRIPMMEENFSVLNGMGEDLIPGPQQDLVEKMLVNVNRTWIDLQVCRSLFFYFTRESSIRAS